jgi:hypothetical protein
LELHEKSSLLRAGRQAASVHDLADTYRQLRGVTLTEKRHREGDPRVLSRRL